MNLVPVLESILTDRLDEAWDRLQAAEDRPELLTSLLQRARASGSPAPLAGFTENTPPYVAVHASYTCDVRCRMCNSGFQNRTELYDDYKVFTPEQFEALLPWMENATHVFFVGVGETLDSPHIERFLERMRHKITVVTTSGVPLTEARVRALIERDLDILNISFDGRTSVGHGGGRDTYIDHIWDRIGMVHRVRREMNLTRPEVGLHFTVNLENLEDLPRVLERARDHGIRDVLVLPMTVTNGTWAVNEMLYAKSLASDFERSRDRLNDILDEWNGRGMRVNVHEYPVLEDALPVCPYVDNVMQFHGRRDRPTICCGPLLMPIALNGHSPEAYWNAFPFRYFRYLHFAAEPTRLPQECQDCWVMHPGQYAETCRRQMQVPPGRDALFMQAYREASGLKAEGNCEAARTGFHRLLAQGVSGELKGKTHFHLAEIDLLENRLESAQDHLERAVQHCYDHLMAFACLYLVLKIHPLPPVRERLPKFDMNYRAGRALNPPGGGA